MRRKSKFKSLSIFCIVRWSQLYIMILPPINFLFFFTNRTIDFFSSLLALRRLRKGTPQDIIALEIYKWIVFISVVINHPYWIYLCEKEEEVCIVWLFSTNTNDLFSIGSPFIVISVYLTIQILQVSCILKIIEISCNLKFIVRTMPPHYKSPLTWNETLVVCTCRFCA